MKDLILRIKNIGLKGAKKEAIELLDRLASQNPDDYINIMLSKADMLEQIGNIGEAIAVYHLIYTETFSHEIVEYLKKRYYEPKRDWYYANYCNNIKLFKEYKYSYATFTEYSSVEELENSVGIYPIYYDNEDCYFIEEETFVHCNLPVVDKKNYRVGTILAENIVDAKKIKELREEFPAIFYEGQVRHGTPILLYYAEEKWKLFLLIIAGNEALEDKEIIYVEGENQLRKLIQDDLFAPPEIICCVDSNKIARIINEEIERIIREKEILIKKNENYYSDHKEEIKKNIKNKQPTVAIFTTRYSTVLQYHSRNIYESLKALGLDAYFIIEEDDIQRLSARQISNIINELKPDLAFRIDYFSHGHSAFPKDMPSVTWIQDPLEHIMNKEAPKELRDNEWILTHFTTWKKYKEIGYPEDREMDAPVPANHRVYKPYELTKEEREQYSCDICFVCHGADVRRHLTNILRGTREELLEALASIYLSYKDYVYKTGNVIYAEDHYIEYVAGSLREDFGINSSDELVNLIANDMYLWYNQRVFRQCLVDWLLDAGYTNIKLWGNGWKDEEKYAPYAMGPAENGETLSKIYQASKIVVGNNTATTAAARAWESMLSGAFYLVNYIPPDEDYTDIRKILSEDEYVMFNGKDDFINKVEYYLTHEEDRLKMIEIGRNAALERMTFDSLVEKMLDFLASKI